VSGDVQTTQESDGSPGAHALGTPGGATAHDAQADRGHSGDSDNTGSGSGGHAVAVSPTRGSQLQFGPVGEGRTSSPFNSRQLTRLDEALTLSSKESGLYFSVYVGELQAPTRGHAESLFERLTDASVLLAISPGQRVLHIVTGPESAKRLPNRACALAALAMRASFSSGDLTGGIVIGLRMLADSAGSA
jgi:hypothetical protein